MQTGTAGKVAAHPREHHGVRDPIGGRIPDGIVLTRDEAARVMLALDDAVEAVDVVELRQAPPRQEAGRGSDQLRQP